MKILQINLGNYGSTGKIMMGVEKSSNNNNTFCMVYPNTKNNVEYSGDKILISGIISRKVNHFLEKCTGFQGCFSILKTHTLISNIKKYDPDIIHLHNIHGIEINYPLLFKYIKKNKIKIIWTLHDCWSFTGQCPHFTIIKCDKWKTGCFKCPQYKEYPEAFVDRTKMMWKLKRKWFNNVENMTIVTPSIWLSNLVKESYLKNYPVQVINNGIDLSIFKPRKSEFKTIMGLEGKKIILGVSFTWGKKKGLDVFYDLSKIINDDYVIVLVGLNNVDELKDYENIYAIPRTNNQIELAEIYTSADVFVNPTREDNFPTVNIESLACGTPVVTFNTGGSPEIIDSSCGLVVECGDLEKLKNTIVDITSLKKTLENSCVSRAHCFNMYDKFKDYLKLYDTV